MPVREDVEFTSGADRCAAWLYRPDSATGRVPCVVMAHGFGATRADRLPAYAERFAAAGFAALLFDYRHFGDSGGEPRQLLDISRQLDDYRAAIGFARGLDGIDPLRIALFGSSFSGGHVVTIAAGDRSIAAVIAQAPFADGLPTVVAVGARNALRGAALGIVDQLGALAGHPPRMMPTVGPPGSFAAMTAPEAEPGVASITGEGSRWRNEVAARVMLHIAQYRPVARASKVRCPLFVAICDRDETTPPEPAAKLAEKAPRGELVRYPIGHFDIYTGEDFERAVADQAAFLNRTLARVAVPDAG
ncbi:MAG: alpha/beta hydrolase [Actinomycetota bacterium]|nr:alpha/beta hydrolase [Actinomycetota bacterium]